MNSNPDHHSEADNRKSENGFGSLRDAWHRPEQWARHLVHSPRGLWSLGMASFLETIIVPIPIEVILIPYMLMRRDLLWTIALVTTLTCLLGAIVGYGVGFFLFESVGRSMVAFMGWEQDFATFQQWFYGNGFWAILAIGITPIPFQVAMLVAGLSGFPFYLFVLAACVARGIRYFGLALLVNIMGDRALELWKRNKLVTGLVLLFVIGGIFALNLLILGGNE